MEALHDLVKMGKLRYIGASAMYLHQFAAMQHVAAQHGWTQFSAMQNHYNAIYREEERSATTHSHVSPPLTHTPSAVHPTSPSSSPAASLCAAL